VSFLDLFYVIDRHYDLANPHLNKILMLLFDFYN